MIGKVEYHRSRSQRPLLTGTITARTLTEQERARRDAGEHRLDAADANVDRRQWHLPWLVVGAVSAAIMLLLSHT